MRGNPYPWERSHSQLQMCGNPYLWERSHSHLNTVGHVERNCVCNLPRQDCVFHDFPIVLKRFLSLFKVYFCIFHSTRQKTVFLIKGFCPIDYVISWGFPQEIVTVNYLIQRDCSDFSSKELWSYLTSFRSPERIRKSFKCYQVGASICKTIPRFPGWSPWWSQLPGKTPEEPGYCPFWGMRRRGKCLLRKPCCLKLALSSTNLFLLTISVWLWFNS